jgi:hypothetical protein
VLSLLKRARLCAKELPEAGLAESGSLKVAALP